MALPVTITGISTGTTPVGPFKASTPFIMVAPPVTPAVASFGHTSAGVQWEGQSFTTVGAIEVRSITVWAAKFGTPTDDVQITIHATDPTGAVIATSAALTAASFITNPSIQTADFVFSPAVSLAAATSYGFKIARTGSLNATNYYAVQFRSASVYGGGILYNDVGASSGDLAFAIGGTDAYYFFGVDSSTGALQAYKATDPTNTILIDTLAGGSVATPVGYTASTQRLSQSFTTVDAISFQAIRTVVQRFGSPADNLLADVYLADGSGFPTGSSLGQSTAISAASISTSGVQIDMVWPAAISLSASTQYCVVWSRSGAFSSSNYIAVSGQNTSSYAGGLGGNYNGSSWGAGTAELVLQVFNGLPWASVASVASGGASLLTLAAYQVGATIHLLIGSTQGGTALCTYRTFDATTDAFVLGESVLGATNTTGQTGAVQTGCSLVVRSNGEVVAFFNGATTNTMGTAYARVYYSRRTGVNTWTAAVEVDSSTAADSVVYDAVLGLSDRVHFFFTNATSGTINYTRTLTSGNTLGTAAGYGSSGQYNRSKCISYVDGAAVKVRAVISINGLTFTTISGFDSADSPTVTIFGNTASGASPARLYCDIGGAPDLYVLGATTTLIQSHKSTDDGTTISSGVTLMTSTFDRNAQSTLSDDGKIYQRGNNVVIPYIVNDNGTLKYNEYMLRYADALYSVLASSVGANFGWASAGNHEQVAQSVLVPSGKQWTVSRCRVEIYKTNSPTDTVKMEIRSGTADGSLLGTSTNTVSGSSLTTTGAFNEFIFNDVVLPPGVNFFVLLRTGTLDDTHNYKARVITDNSYVDGDKYQKVVGSGWTSSVNVDMTMEVAGVEADTPPIADAWSASDRQASTTLTNGDKTVEATAQNRIRATTAYPASGADKYYFEVKIDVLGASNASRIGVNDTTTAIASILTSGAKYFSYNANGFMSLDGSTVVSGAATFTTGDVVCIAWDTVNKRGWARKGSGIWNNSGTADPATNVGGFDLSSWTDTTTAAAMLFAASDKFTIRTELAELTEGSYPSGFKTWMGETMGPTMPVLVAGTGAITVAGQTVTLRRTRIMAAATGAVAVSGQAVILKRGYNMAAGTGAVTSAGNAVTLRRARVMPAAVRAIAIAGQLVTLRRTRIMAAATGAVTLARDRKSVV